MINVRYGLLSTAGVCFALALGVLVGAGPLQGDTEERHRADQQHAEEEQQRLRQRLDTAAAEQAHQDAFLDAVDTQLVGGALADRYVVVLTLPGVDHADSEALTEAIEAAGAQVTGEVGLLPRWAEPGQQQFLEDLSARLVTEDTELPEEGGAYERAAAVLARALVTDDADLAGGADDNAGAGILSGMEAGDLVTVPAELARAELAVVLTPAPAGDAPDADEQEAADAAWTAVAGGLHAASAGAVVAGPSGDAGAVAAVRADSAVAGEVSSVDSVDLASGRVATVLALAEQLNDGAGHYGAAESADAPAPEPVPAAEPESEDVDEAEDVDEPAADDEDPEAGTGDEDAEG